MELWEHIKQQRIQYIIRSYRLVGDDTEAFAAFLTALLERYPSPLLELALVETLADRWLSVPLPRGVEFLKTTQQKLQYWDANPKVPRISPSQFQQIAGLDPTPVFGCELAKTWVVPER